MSHVATWLIAAVAVIGVITRPKNWPEAWWAVSGALALVAFSLISPMAALGAVEKGTDVYLFLIGMMILAELARREGLFDWLAAYALVHARGSGNRLFLLIYAVGTLVTIFLSNDATAVVLTPAVYAVARHAKAPPLPYLLICAFIANAASFVLPISNPANLVVFGDQMPPLREWLGEFAAASAVSVDHRAGRRTAAPPGRSWHRRRRHCGDRCCTVGGLSDGLAAGSSDVHCGLNGLACDFTAETSLPLAHLGKNFLERGSSGRRTLCARSGGRRHRGLYRAHPRSVRAGTASAGDDRPDGRWLGGTGVQSHQQPPNGIDWSHCGAGRGSFRAPHGRAGHRSGSRPQ